MQQSKRYGADAATGTRIYKKRNVSSSAGTFLNHRQGDLHEGVFYRLISQLLVISLIVMPFSTQAAVIGTGEVIAGAQGEVARDKVRDFMARAEVQEQLQSFGLNPDTAKDRVNALTDQEVQHLAGKIDSLPAGAISGWEVVALTALLIIVIYIALKFIYGK